MNNTKKGLNRLYSIYEKLTKNEKEKIIKFGEALLNSQDILYEEKQAFERDNFEKDKIEEFDKYKYLPLMIPSNMKIYESNNNEEKK